MLNCCVSGKKRTDKHETKTLVPGRGLVDSAEVDTYIQKLNDDLGIFGGPCFCKYNHLAFFCQQIGKNLMAKVLLRWPSC